MWKFNGEFNISQIIVNDLFDGVESDLKEVRIRTENFGLLFWSRELLV